MTKDPAREYQSIKNRLMVVNLAFDLVLLLSFIYSGLSVKLAAFASEVSSSALVVNGIYLIVFAVGFHSLHAPLSYYGGFALEHRFKLSNQTFGQWLADDIKKGLLGLALFLVMIEVLYVFLGTFPRYWWVGAGSFWFFVSFILAKLTPNVIIPIFYKYSDVQNEAIVGRIKELFKKCAVRLKHVYAINLSKKSKKANAFLCGLGNNRRVVLSDTLLNDFSDEEIEVVVAHELGHYKHRDIVKLLGLNMISSFLGLYLVNLFLQWAMDNMGLMRIDDIAFFPMIILSLSIFGLIVTPFVNGFTRLIEREADRFSLETTRNVEGFVSVMERLAAKNLADKNPARWVEIFLYDHPSIGRRVEFAKQWGKIHS